MYLVFHLIQTVVTVFCNRPKIVEIAPVNAVTSNAGFHTCAMDKTGVQCPTGGLLLVNWRTHSSLSS